MRTIIGVLALVPFLAQAQAWAADDATHFQFKGYRQDMTFEEATAVAHKNGETLQPFQNVGPIKSYVTSGTGLALAFVGNHLEVVAAQVQGGVQTFDKLVGTFQHEQGMIVYQSYSSIIDTPDKIMKTTRLCKGQLRYYVEISLYDFASDKTHTSISYFGPGVTKCIPAATYYHLPKLKSVQYRALISDGYANFDERSNGPTLSLLMKKGDSFALCAFPEKNDSGGKERTKSQDLACDILDTTKVSTAPQ